ncbi:MAG: hypothetical protein ABIH48_01495 [Candidatus Falkowbacteria bacterium]
MSFAQEAHTSVEDQSPSLVKPENIEEAHFLAAEELGITGDTERKREYLTLMHRPKPINKWPSEN